MCVCVVTEDGAARGKFMWEFMNGCGCIRPVSARIEISCSSFHRNIEADTLENVGQIRNEEDVLVEVRSVPFRQEIQQNSTVGGRRFR